MKIRVLQCGAFSTEGKPVGFVIIPGIDGSDEKHWQSIWQYEWGAAARRISPSSWESPDLDDWCAAIDRALDGGHVSDMVLVAHSLGCWAAIHWLSRRRADVAGVFLVAPPDRAGPSFPSTAAPTFAAMAQTGPLDVPSVLVCSDDDPYCRPEIAEHLAVEWDVPLIAAGPVGHINSASGLGRWDLGFDLLTAFTAGTGVSVRMRPSSGG